MTLCINAFINMEDKYSLNLDKFNLWVNFFKLSIVFNNKPADMD